MSNTHDISNKLSEFFRTHLPITQFMRMDVEHYDRSTLILAAPLEPNINDKLTAFGGSLYNAAVMACWGMTYLKTLERGIQCNQVVTKGSIEYKRPVTGNIRAVCHVPDTQTLEHFFDSFDKKGRARITLKATIECDNQIAVEFEGQYAILKE